MKAFLRLYPPFLLFMVLYVQLAAIVLNHEIYDYRDLLVFACWIPVFTIPGLYFKNQRWYVITVCVFFTGGLLNLIHWLILKGPISASSLFILLNTNIGEAGDFLTLKSSFLLLLLLPYLLLFYFAIRKKPDSEPVNKYLVLIISILIGIFFTEAIIHNRFVRKTLPPASKALVSFSRELKTFKNLKLREVKKIDAKRNYSGEQIGVLIIGESCNRNHMSLYGYGRSTNPRLESRNDILVYRDVVSPYSNTIGSVLTMLTESNLENRMNYDQAVSLIDVFYSAGFETIWLSNQSPIGIWDNAVFDLARTSDRTVFTNNYSNSSFESITLSPYDEKLLQPLSEILTADSHSKFIVVHLMGNHAAYSKRYPVEYKKFRTHSGSREKLINEYDNSMLYNDFIVDSIFEILAEYSHKHKSSHMSAVYIGDHGENVFDENENVGHDYAGSLPRANVEIPMIIWLSDSFIKSDSTRFKTLQTNNTRPFVSDDLFHALIDLNKIEFSGFIPERSVFNSKFDFKRRRILEDGKDYDEKRKE